MGQLIKFPEPAMPTQSDREERIKEAKANKTSAEVLFFTGVRYERPTSLPSQRLAQPGTLS